MVTPDARPRRDSALAAHPPADFPLATSGVAAVKVFFTTLRKNWEQNG